MKQKKEIFKCYIKVLTPVHIGCGEDYEPTGFTVNEQENTITTFNPVDFISDLSVEDKQRFTEICKQGTIESILELYKFMSNRSADGVEVNVCSEFMAHFKKTKSLPPNNKNKIQNELNNFVIPRTAFIPSDSRAYIPGSAVKGALRTAYLNQANSQTKIQKPKKSDELQKKLLKYSDISDDPFRLVKVSDFMPVGSINKKVLYAVNVKKKPSDKETQGNAQLFEVIEPGCVFKGYISVEQPELGAGINKAIDLQGVLSGLSFFKREKKREDSELAFISKKSPHHEDSTDSFLLRCGRHSGAESVTVEGHRDIKIMRGKGEKPNFMNKATTFWLASESKKPGAGPMAPFGWMVLNALSPDQEQSFTSEEQAWTQTVNSKKKEKKDQKQAILIEKQEKEKAEQERKLKEAEDARKRQEAEEAERLKLENMDPEDRILHELSKPDVSEEHIVEIYQKIDAIPETRKVEVATAIKQCYVNMGKWKKKNCSNKQLDKVNKIKGILGE